MQYIGEVKFWCQKVLPLVFDDSLSYYEVLCKLTAKLNEVITSTNEIPEYIVQVIKEYIENGEIEKILQDLLSDYMLNVKFPPNNITPAVGDGATNDTQSFTECLSYAATKGLSVYVPNGTYMLSSLSVPQNVSLVGAGRYNVRLVQLGGATSPLISLTNENNLLSGITFDGNSSVQSTKLDCIYATKSNYLFAGIGIQNANIPLHMDTTAGHIQITDLIISNGGEHFVVTTGDAVITANIHAVNLSTLAAINGFDIDTNNGNYTIHCDCAAPTGIKLVGDNNIVNASVFKATAPIDNVGQFNTINLQGINNDINLYGDHSITADKMSIFTEQPLQYGTVENLNKYLSCVKMQDINGNQYQVLVQTPDTVNIGSGIFANVKEYGAVGDGVTDDYAAVMAAYADSNNVYFPEGEYLLKQPLVCKSNSIFFFNGAALKVYVTASDVVDGKLLCENKNLIYAKDVDNVTFIGLTIKSIYDNSYGPIGDNYFTGHNDSECVLFLRNVSNLKLINFTVANMCSVWNSGQDYYPNVNYAYDITMTANTMKIVECDNLYIKNLRFVESSCEEILFYKCENPMIDGVYYDTDSYMTSLIGFWFSNGGTITNARVTGYCVGNCFNFYGNNNKLTNSIITTKNVNNNHKAMTVDISLECNRIYYPLGINAITGNEVNNCIFNNAQIVSYYNSELNITGNVGDVYVNDCQFNITTDTPATVSSNAKNGFLLMFAPGHYHVRNSYAVVNIDTFDNCRLIGSVAADETQKYLTLQGCKITTNNKPLIVPFFCVGMARITIDECDIDGVGTSSIPGSELNIVNTSYVSNSNGFSNIRAEVSAYDSTLIAETGQMFIADDTYNPTLIIDNCSFENLCNGWFGVVEITNCRCEKRFANIISRTSVACINNYVSGTYSSVFSAPTVTLMHNSMQGVTPTFTAAGTLNIAYNAFAAPITASLAYGAYNLPEQAT